ncbi:hypothetical protein KNE206_30650 [Kitasatospora sp. NE20-6]
MHSEPLALRAYRLTRHTWQTTSRRIRDRRDRLRLWSSRLGRPYRYLLNITNAAALIDHWWTWTHPGNSSLMAKVIWTIINWCIGTL